MTHVSIQEFISLPIAQHGELSKAFKSRCARRELHTLKDLFALGSNQLLEQYYLGTACFEELLDFLHRRQLVMFLPD
ncbi:hypothetical protein [Olivibacter sitiensis]|uniref:hypothetical protein n=1 Tax=Olivibacter sitiensis TaxID=376470 RepID=UPI0003F83116|nr:hypothetical protein [Olivibacter sitiensis]